jgi:hypothetical protein
MLVFVDLGLWIRVWGLEIQDDEKVCAWFCLRWSWGPRSPGGFLDCYVDLSGWLEFRAGTMIKE